MSRSDTRRRNLASLVASRSQAEVAAKIGKDRNQIYQWLLDPSEPASRNIGDRSAEAIEDAFGLPRGWMDRETPTVQEPHTPYGLASQSTQLDPETVRSAHQLIRGVYEDEGKVYDIEAEPDLFVAAYAKLAAISGRPSLANVASIVREIDRQRAESGDENGGDGRSGEAAAAASKKRASR